MIGTKLAGESLIYSKSSEIVAGEEYQFYVKANNDIGDSTNSDTIKIMAASEPQPPSLFVTDS